MRKRRGLRAKMAVSYVLVTAAAVAVVELVGLAFVVPRLFATASADRTLIVQLTARDLAGEVMKRSIEYGRLPHEGEMRLGDPALRLGPGEARAALGDSSVLIPYVTTELDDSKPMSLALLLDLSGTVLLSSYPARHPVGERYGGDEVVALSADVLTKFESSEKGASGGESNTSAGPVYWAIASVYLFDLNAGRKAEARSGPVGFVYVQVPADDRLPSVSNVSAGSTWWSDVLSRLGAGLVVLLVALPVGAVFGLLATRSLIGRLRRLVASTVAVADGNYRHRIPVSGTDEVAQLESNFNRMAERLTEAMVAERELAGASERARIARELHDAISQDLFSLRVLAGGMRRALPAGSPLYRQAATMETTATGTMHEMQALLLALRPIALDDVGLIPALEALCQAYRDRLGVAVDARLDPVRLTPPVEHAVLRIVQEALTNAVKHGHPDRLTLEIRADGERVAVSIADNGTGFDPSQAAQRHGMGLDLMRERVAELGGEFQLDSAVGAGTTVRVLLPGGQP
jgi:signal transduction histidine kinase